MPDCDIDSETLRCKNCGWLAPKLAVKRNCRGHDRLVRDDDDLLLLGGFQVCGPGCHLSRLLSRLGFKNSHGCKCSHHAKRMDEWGADQCEARFEEICGWLQEEARKRGIPYLSVVSRMLVRRAISNARKEAERAKTQT